MTEIPPALLVSRQQKQFPVASADNEQLRLFYELTEGASGAGRGRQRVDRSVLSRSGDSVGQAVPG